MRVTNLTNSPHDLVNAEGEKVRLPARGAVESFEPHPLHAGLYRSIGYFRIEDDAKPDAETGQPDASGPAAVDTDAGDDSEGGTGAVDGQDAGDADADGDVIEAADPREPLREEYHVLSGKPADKRWSKSRLQSEIEKLKG